MGGSFWTQSLVGVCIGAALGVVLRWSTIRRAVRFRRAYLAAPADEQARIRRERVDSSRRGLRLVALVIGILCGIFLLGGVIAFFGGDGLNGLIMLGAALGYLSLIGLVFGLGWLFTRLLMPRR